HLGFVGSDWNWHGRRWYGRLFRPLFRQASLITATGEAMRREMIQAGLPAERILILPHGVDLSRFRPSLEQEAEFDCIFVGRLVALKRVDVILTAFAQVVAARPGSRLCIVGDGPLRPELEALASRLGFAGQVEFVGSVRDVECYLSRARILLIASEREGLPFALIEGLAAGLAPIVTPVGSLGEFVSHETNGLHVPVGDAAALAGAIIRLLADEDLYRRLRQNVAALRPRLGYAAAQEVWETWLRRVAASDERASEPGACLERAEQ
ncbi:MAG: glycosyltransferase, partial [Candidatus Promineifilaceae bacterium]